MATSSTHTEQFIPRLNPDFVARALHLVVPGNQSRPTQPFTSVTSDSRKVRPGCLFVAIQGEKNDGHDFIAAAIAHGARGVLYKRGTQINDSTEIAHFPVEDTLGAYRRLAAAWRREFSIPVVAVAGSVGKTTTKEMLFALLRGKWDTVLKTEGSQNGFVGIPMTLLELRPEHAVAVIEVGIDEPGAMEKHMQLVHPTISVLTAIGAEHLEKLKDIPTVAREEGEALRMVSQTGGTAVINMDDPWIRPHHHTLRVGKKVKFSLKTEDAREGGLTGALDPATRTLTVTGMQLANEKFDLPLPGLHNASNLLAALSVAASLGLTAEEMQKGLKTFQGAYGRSELRDLRGSPIVCDYYNANPDSMRAGLEVLSEQSERPRWACLGDMLELGQAEIQFHQDLADPIERLGIENVLLFGPRMKSLAQALASRGYKGRVEHFETAAELARVLTQNAKKGEPILIKGSRGMKMEEIWNTLEPYAKTHWN